MFLKATKVAFLQVTSYVRYVNREVNEFLIGVISEAAAHRVNLPVTSATMKSYMDTHCGTRIYWAYNAHTHTIAAVMEYLSSENVFLG